jgi:hypothetical protein
MVASGLWQVLSVFSVYLAAYFKGNGGMPCVLVVPNDGCATASTKRKSAKEEF